MARVKNLGQKLFPGVGHIFKFGVYPRSGYLGIKVNLTGTLVNILGLGPLRSKYGLKRGQSLTFSPKLQGSFGARDFIRPQTPSKRPSTGEKRVTPLSPRVEHQRGRCFLSSYSSKNWERPQYVAKRRILTAGRVCRGFPGTRS